MLDPRHGDREATESPTQLEYLRKMRERFRVTNHCTDSNLKCAADHPISTNEDSFSENSNTNSLSERTPALGTDDAWNKCVYTCELCNITLHSHKQFVYHLKELHSIQYKNYVKSHAPFRNWKFWKCLQCSTETTVRWDEHFINEHLMEKHQMTLREYRNKYNL